jgi:hypothetical protein
MSSRDGHGSREALETCGGERLAEIAGAETDAGTDAEDSRTQEEQAHVFHVSSEITWAAMVRRPMCFAARVR